MPPKNNKKTEYDDDDDDEDEHVKNINEEDDDDDKDEDDKDEDDKDDDDDDNNNNNNGKNDEDEDKDDDDDEDDDNDDESDDEAEGNGDDNYLKDMGGGGAGTNEDDDNDDESDDKYKKITKYINKDELLKYHTECIVQNYDEIRGMSDIQLKSGHVTIPLLTKYERARIIGMRTVQLNNGAAPLVDVPDTLLDNTIIAEKELVVKKIPFIICRPLPDGRKEYWKLEDLEILNP